MNDGYSEKPDNISNKQWNSIKKLHENLAHPPNTTLMRMLSRWSATREVLDAVKNLKCSVCQEIRGRQPSRRAAVKVATHFGHWVSYDEFEVNLSDGAVMMLMMIVDEASNYVTVVPMPDVTRSPNWEKVKHTLEIGWLMWAGPPENLRFDSHKSHLSEAARRFCDEQGITAHPTPPESHNANALVEERIEFFKSHFYKVNAACQLTADDDPFGWASRIAAAQNAHLRYGGFRRTSMSSGRTRVSLLRCSPMPRD